MATPASIAAGGPAANPASADLGRAPVAWRDRADELAADAQRARERRAAAALWLEAAALYAENDPQGPAHAIDLAERALALVPGDAAAMALLERAHQATGAWAGLCERLARLAATTRDGPGRAALLLRLAIVENDRLGDEALAARDAERALAADPSSADAAEVAIELHVRLGRLAEAGALLERHLAAAPSSSGQVGWRLRIADAAVAAGDRALAVAQLEAAWLASPGAPEIAARLQPIWEEAGAWDRLADAAEARAAAATGAERCDALLVLARWRAAIGDHAGHAAALERLARDADLPARDRSRAWLGAAGLHAGRLGDARRAFACAAEAVRADPADDDARAACDRFAADAGTTAELLGVLEEVAPRLAGAPAAERAVRLRAAELAERDPSRRDDAERHLRRVLEIAGGDAAALAGLTRLALATNRLAEARDLLRARADAAPDAERAALLEKLAEVLIDRLGDPAGAAAALDEAMGCAAPEARPRLLRQLARARDACGDGAGRVAALDALSAADRDPREVVECLQAVAAGATGAERARLERRIAGICAAELHQDALAFAALVRAVRAEPSDASARAELRHAAEAAGCEGECARVLREVAADGGDGAADVLADLAALLEEALGDPDGACAAWDAVHARRPGDARAVSELRRLCRARERWADLARACVAAASTPGDADARAAAWREAAEILAERCGDLEGAARAWREVLALAPADERARDALEALLDAIDRPAELAALLESRVAAGPADVARSFRLAELKRLRLGSPAEALGIYAAVLAADARHDGARRAILELAGEPGEVGREALALCDQVVGVESGTADLWDAAARACGSAALWRRAATAHEARGDASAARDAWRAVRRSDPDDTEALEALERLLDGSCDIAERAEVARRRCGGSAGLERERRLARYAALAEEAGDPRAAVDAWVEVLALDGSSRTAITALESLARRPEVADPALRALEEAHRARGDARRLAAVLVTRLRSADPAERGPMLAEIGALHERLGDPDRAARAWAAAARESPGPETFGAVARLAGRRGDWRARAGALQRLAACEPGSRRAADARREVADIMETRLGDRDGAVAAWREVLDHDPENPSALEHLDSLLTSLERWGDLVAVLERRSAVAGRWRSAEAAALDVRAGRIRQERMGDVAGALACYRAALQRAPASAEARDALHSLAVAGSVDAAALLEPLYAAEGAHQRRVEVLEVLARSGDDPRGRARFLVELARVRGEALGDPEAAFLQAAQALREDPDSAAALGAVADLADAAGLRDQLPELLAGCAERAGDAAQRLDALRRLARLADEPESAARAWGAVLDLAPGDGEALDGLASAHRARGDASGLAAALRARATTVHERGDRARLLDELASAELTRGDAAAAVSALEARLDLDPEDRATLARLDEALAAAGRWTELTDVLARETALAEAAGDRDAALDLRVRLAGVREERRGDREGALALFEEVLAERPTHEAARAGLEAIVEAEPANLRAATVLLAALERSGSWERLAAVLDLHASALAAGPERKSLLARLAAVRDARLASPELAFAALLRAFRDDPADGALRAALARLAAAAGQDEDLAAAWEELGDRLTGPTAVELQLALGALWERIGDADRAIEWYARARRGDADRAAASLPALDRLCVAASRWAELDDVLAARAERETGPARAELLLRLGTVREERLGDAEGALAAYAGALAADPSSLPARRAHARASAAAGDLAPTVDLAVALAGAGEHAEAAAELRRALDAGPPEPLLDRLDRASAACGAAVERARVAELRALAAGDEREAASRWLEAADLLEQAGDPDRAMSALERAMAADPSRHAALERLRARLHAASDWSRLARVLAEHAERVGFAEQKLALQAEAAGIQEHRLRQPEMAFIGWCRVLQLDPLNAAAAEATARIAAATGAHDELAAVWEQVAEITSGAARSNALSALAELRAAHLGDASGAIAAWRAALESHPSAAGPRDRLAAALEREERWTELAEVLARAREAASPHDRIPVVRRLARVREERLADLAGALDAWCEVAAGDPSATDALDAIDRLAGRLGRFDDLHAALVARAAIATGHERLELLGRCADVCEAHLGDVARAVAHASAMVEADPSCADAFARLARLHRARGEPSACAAALERRAALVADRSERCALWIAAGEARREAGEGAAAERDYREALRVDPEAREALAALADLHEAAGETLAALQALDRLAAVAPSDGDAAAAWARAARIHASRGDAAAAQEAWRRALEADPRNAPALRALRCAAEAAGDRTTTRELLAREALATVDPRERRELCARLGRIHREERQDLAAARRWYEEALAATPRDPEVSRALADVHLATGDLASAEPLLACAAEESGDAAPRDSARRFHRLAVVRERLGRAAAALDAERRAARADPAYLPAALALPELLAAAGAWEEALAALRALVANHAAALTREELAAAHRRSGEIEERLGRPGRAVASYERALDLEPGDAETHRRVAAVLESQGDHRGAVVHRRRAAAALEGAARADALISVAVTCRDRLDDRDGAVEAFGAALRADPARVEALAALEPLLAESGRWRELERHYRAAIDRLPAGPGARVIRLVLWRGLAALYDGPLADAEGARTASQVVASLEGHAPARDGG